MLFKDIAIGERFRFFGKVYSKIAKSMTEDEKGDGDIFGDDHEVERIEPEAPRSGE